MNRAETYAQAKERGAVIDFSARAKWRVNGADRVRFINGQVSNDVRKLASDRAIHACVMTVKGKMSGDVFISSDADSLFLDAEASLRETLAARLERYIISDDVTIADATDDMCLFHIAIGAAKLLPPEITDVRQISAIRFCHPGIDLLAPASRRDELWQQLGEIFVQADDELADTFRIEAGVPRWGAELDEDTIPVEAGLDKTAIDYHKGCYIGQEIISRLKSIGHVNRQLRGFVSAAQLSAGMELFAPGSDKAAGRLTGAAWSFGLEKFAALG